MFISVPLHALRAFEAAARLGSFTAAAAELNMSQAAVSFQIRGLERRVGKRLFDRDSRGVELTAAGRSAAPLVIEGFARIASGLRALEDHGRNKIGLTASPTIAATWLAPRLAAFQLRHPDVLIHLDTSIELQELGSQFDLSIRNGAGSWPNVQSHFLMPNLFTPLCSPALLETGKAGVANDLVRLPLRGKLHWWRQWAEESGLEVCLPDRVAQPFAIDHLDVSVALAGHGVVIASPIFFGDELRKGTLVQPFRHISRQSDRDYWLCHRGSLPPKSPAARLRQYLLSEAETVTEDRWVSSGANA